MPQYNVLLLPLPNRSTHCENFPSTSRAHTLRCQYVICGSPYTTLPRCHICYLHRLTITLTSIRTLHFVVRLSRYTLPRLFSCDIQYHHLHSTMSALHSGQKWFAPPTAMKDLTATIPLVTLRPPPPRPLPLPGRDSEIPFPDGRHCLPGTLRGGPQTHPCCRGLRRPVAILIPRAPGLSSLYHYQTAHSFPVTSPPCTYTWSRYTFLAFTFC